MTAVGPVETVATGVLTGGFAAGAAWAVVSREVEAIRTRVQKGVRIEFLKMLLANHDCTKPDAGEGARATQGRPGDTYSLAL
jgi:hypothetical protein